MKSKTIKSIILALICLVLLSGSAYLGYKYYRLRAAFIQLNTSYQQLETSFSDEQSKNLTKDERLRSIANNLQTKNAIITNDLSVNYALFPNPNDVLINDKELMPYETGQQVKLLTFGHSYASPDSDNPPKVLTENLDYFNTELSPDLLILMGDMVEHPTEASFDALKDAFLNQLSMPVYNAVGNHDIDAGWTFYQEAMGQTFFSFAYGPAQIIVLDTEIGNCFILGQQEEMLAQAITKAKNNPEIQYIFIFMHKVLFQSMGLPGVGNLNTNHTYCDLFGSNFETTLNERLIPISEEKPVYIFAGDVGKAGNEFSYFTSQLEGKNVFFNTVGIGEKAADAVMLITYDANSVTLEKIPLFEKQP